MIIRFYIVLGLLMIIASGLRAQKYVTDLKMDANFFETELQEVLVEVSKSTGVNISFDPEIIKDKELISINVNDVTLGDFLDVILDGQNLEYRLNGKQIILLPSRNEKEFKFPTKELSGYIEDSTTGERLPFAYLFTADGKVFTTANEYGFYNLSIPGDQEEIIISYLGFDNKRIRVADLQSGKVDLNLASSKQLSEVVIVSSKERPVIESFDIFVNADLERVSEAEGFLGEFDVVRHLNTLPGVSTSADGLGGMSVRGANADNNLILLDGVPVYNSNHALGVMSIFNDESIKSTKFYRSHIPAQYGGRLSSVLDIRTKEGSLKKYSSSISLGLLTAKGFVEGPVIKDRASFAISARRTLLEPYITPISKVVKRANGQDGETSYKFGDFNAKIQLVVNPKNRIYLSYYGGFDDFNDQSIAESTALEMEIREVSSYDWRWGNNLFSLRWNSQFADNVFSNVTIYSSSYNFSAFNLEGFQVDTMGTQLQNYGNASLYDTRIQDYGLQWNGDYYLNAINKIKFGIQSTFHTFKPGLLSQKYQNIEGDYSELKVTLEESFLSPARTAIEFESYVEDEISYKNSITNIGLRFSAIQSQGKTYYNLQPRFSSKLKLIDKVYGKISANMTSQYLHLLASSGLGLPTDIWIPSTSRIKPQRAYQGSAGIDIELTKQLTFSSEVYYKYMQNILNLKEGAVFSVIEDQDWENDIPVGMGENFGIEIGLVGKITRHYINLNYTYGKSIRKFEKINSGRPFYSRFDRRHQAKLNYQLTINKNISFSANWIYATGHPLTLPTVIDNNEFIYTEKNNQRLPIYDRLDIAFNIKNEFDWGSQNISLGVFNVYNKKNPYYYFLDIENQDALTFQVKQITVFPILPNISYTINF